MKTGSYIKEWRLASPWLAGGQYGVFAYQHLTPCRPARFERCSRNLADLDSARQIVFGLSDMRGSAQRKEWCYSCDRGGFSRLPRLCGRGGPMCSAD